MKHLNKMLLAFVVVVMAGVLSYKIGIGAITFDMSDFSFNDLLALLLALFSIALSLIFYHKATETSNTFYDNTYKFTNHVSEVLGRIESGFSERLRHIDEGYTKLEGRLDQMPFAQKKEAEKAIKVEEQKIGEKEKERDVLLEDLAHRAKLQEDEKKSILEKLRAQEKELSEAKAQLELSRKRLHESEIAGGSLFRSVVEFTRMRVIPMLGQQTISAGSKALSKRFNEVMDGFPKAFIRDMAVLGFLNGNNELTDKGVRFLLRQSHSGNFEG